MTPGRRNFQARAQRIVAVPPGSLSPEAIEAFVEAYRLDTGLTLDPDAARTEAMKLLRLMQILSRPVGHEDYVAILKEYAEAEAELVAAHGGWPFKSITPPK